MAKTIAACALVLGVLIASATAQADPYICVGGMTDVEVVFHVKQDPYFRRNLPYGKALRLEYDGCGYRIHVGESSPHARDGDLLLVDRYGHVTRIEHRRRPVDGT